MAASQTQAVMLAEFGRRARSTSASNVGGRRADNLVRRRDLSRDHRRIARKPEAEDKITAVGFVFEAGIRENEMRVQAGVLGGEDSKERRNMSASKIRRSSYPQQAARCTSARGDLSFRVAN